MVTRGFTAPTGRAIGWAVLGDRVRWGALRELAAVEGLDGEAAAAAITHALRSDESPWCGPVDTAVQRALSAVIDTLLAPVGAFVRQAGEQLGRAVARMAEQLDECGVAGDDESCRCLCGTHREQGLGVCLGLDAIELYSFTFPGPPLTQQRRTVQMCGPCAAAQDERMDGLRQRHETPATA